jgi:hypothetical protein
MKDNLCCWISSWLVIIVVIIVGGVTMFGTPGLEEEPLRAS